MSLSKNISSNEKMKLYSFGEKIIHSIAFELSNNLSNFHRDNLFRRFKVTHFLKEKSQEKKKNLSEYDIWRTFLEYLSNEGVTVFLFFVELRRSDPKDKGWIESLIKWIHLKDEIFLKDLDYYKYKPYENVR